MKDEEHEFERQVAELYRRPVPIDPQARERLARALIAPPSSDPRAWLERLWKPRVIALSPIAAAAALFVVLGTGAWIGRGTRPPSPADRPATARPAVAGEQRVAFVVVAPGAASVAVVGDFNGWDASAHPMLRARDGETWTTSIPIRDGHHLYSFVVDGSRWMPDPVAPLAPQDEFGARNSVIVVGGSDS